MNKLGHRYRRSKPSDVLQRGFEGAIREFSAAFLKSAPFKHALSKGEEREVPIQNLFRANLPEAFGVDKGEAADLFGRHSPQLDVMIFDRMRNSPLYRGPIVILPAEALLVSVEVKSLLTSVEIKSILKAAVNLRRLRPFKESLSPVRHAGVPAEGRPRFFHCVFAYESDLSGDKWLESEMRRFLRAACELGIAPSVIDRVYVANRGLMNLEATTGVEEEADQGTALLQFYMHILNFLLRENRRRDSVPYMDYAGTMAGGWKSFRDLN